jgi:transposase
MLWSAWNACSPAQGHDPVALALVRSMPGIGHILALVILYEIERIKRFARVQDFLSYCRYKCS